VMADRDSRQGSRQRRLSLFTWYLALWGVLYAAFERIGFWLTLLLALIGAVAILLLSRRGAMIIVPYRYLLSGDAGMLECFIAAIVAVIAVHLAVIVLYLVF